MNTNYRKGKHRYQSYLLKTKAFYQKPLVKASTNLIFTLLIISFFGLFAIKPTLVTVARLGKELQEKQEVNKTLAQKIEALNRAQINYAQIIDDLVLVDHALPEKVEFNQLASQINFLVFSHNLVLVSASFGGFDLVIPEERKITEAEPLDFKISVAGSFPDIKNFLTDLENFERIIQIDSLGFTSQTTATKKGLEAELSAKVFWLPKTVVNQEEKEAE